MDILNKVKTWAAGLAEVAAGAIAMGLGGYLAGKTDIENEEPELQQLAGDLLVAAFSKALDEGKAVINGRDSEQDHPTITLD